MKANDQHTREVVYKYNNTLLILYKHNKEISQNNFKNNFTHLKINY